jgi:glucose uptake protein
VVTSYLANPSGDPILLGAGVLAIVGAIVFDAVAYRRLALSSARTPRLGIILSVAAGILMGFFYRFVVAAMTKNFDRPELAEVGKMGPYAAIVLFSLGVFLSNFVWNSIVMVRPFSGAAGPVRRLCQGWAAPAPGRHPRRHDLEHRHVLSIIASGAAGSAVSYGLGQGATMVAAIWGVFVWKEFRGAPAGTNRLLGVMFVCYVAGIGAAHHRALTQLSGTTDAYASGGCHADRACRRGHR